MKVYIVVDIENKIRLVSASERRANLNITKNYVGVPLIQEHELDITVAELKQATFDASLDQYMQSSVADAQTKGLMNLLDCTREQAIEALKRHRESS